MLTDTFVFAFYARRGQGGGIPRETRVSTDKESKNNCFSDERGSRIVWNFREISRVRINLDNSSLTGKNFSNSLTLTK